MGYQRLNFRVHGITITKKLAKSQNRRFFKNKDYKIWNHSFGSVASKPKYPIFGFFELSQSVNIVNLQNFEHSITNNWVLGIYVLDNAPNYLVGCVIQKRYITSAELNWSVAHLKNIKYLGRSIIPSRHDFLGDLWLDSFLR